MLKVFYVMGKALSGELSCSCDRSCLCDGMGKVLTGELSCLVKGLVALDNDPIRSLEISNFQ